MNQSTKLLTQYFDGLQPKQLEQFAKMQEVYQFWNAQVNVISRKDMEHFYVHHVLHSLAIAKFQKFETGTTVMDVGTGGGFPGLPLAVFFPETNFILVDSIGKKIRVVNAVVDALGLKNVTTYNSRVEELDLKVDFIVSRAVAQMRTFVHWVQGKIAAEQKHQKANGIFYLKGGDLAEELQDFPKAELHPLAPVFDLPFFESKTLVYLPMR
jgi:16S rRNA (guanine527-N7)-methyltransferase